MRILGRGKRFSLAGVLCGLFLLTDVLQADVYTTWSIEDGGLYCCDGIPEYPFPLGQLTGSFTFDSTADEVTGINMQATWIEGVPLPTLTFTSYLLGGDETGLLSFCDDGPCLLSLNFLPYLPAGLGTVGISPTGPENPYPSGLIIEDEVLLTFDGAYVTSPEPSVPVVIFVSAMGMVGLVYARRRRAARVDAG